MNAAISTAPHKLGRVIIVGLLVAGFALISATPSAHANPTDACNILYNFDTAPILIGDDWYYTEPDGTQMAAPWSAPDSNSSGALLMFPGITRLDLDKSILPDQGTLCVKAITVGDPTTTLVGLETLDEDVSTHCIQGCMTMAYTAGTPCYVASGSGGGSETTMVFSFDNPPYAGNEQCDSPLHTAITGQFTGDLRIVGIGVLDPSAPPCDGGCVGDDMCDDGNPCTLDSCVGNICINTPIIDCDSNSPVACCLPDGNCADILASECTSAQGQPHNGLTCAVYASACPVPDCVEGDPCDDDNQCTTNDQCINGSCTGTGTLDCHDGDDCTQDDCYPFNGCVHSAVPPTTPGCEPCGSAFNSQPTSCGQGVCASTGQTLCVNDIITDTCQPLPGQFESCNGIDDDCDGITDNIVQGEGYTLTQGSLEVDMFVVSSTTLFMVPETQLRTGNKHIQIFLLV